MVEEDVDDARVVGAPQPGRLILTLYGLYARQHDGWLAISGVVRLMAEFGVTEQAVRSAIHRLKRRDLLLPRRVDDLPGYALSPSARDILAEGDERIFHYRRAELGEGWIIVVFSVPTAERARRHVLRSHLTRLGLGTVAPGTWVAPRHLESGVRRMLHCVDVDEFVQVFGAEHLVGGDLRDLVREWWDVEGLQRLYAEFLEREGPVLARWRDRPDEDGDDVDARAFTDYVELLTVWRRLPYADPGLPLELLPHDWTGRHAEQVFTELSDRLAERAGRHAEGVLGRLRGGVRSSAR